MDYTFIKYLHVSCAALSYAGFFARGVLMIRAAPLLQARWVQVVPHLVDTLLLGSAIALTMMSQQYPFLEPWLTAKVVALVVYIGLGMVALRRGTTRRGRVTAWIVAQLVFIYIVAVAETRSPILSFG
jgi:uncharacterized membrane protein SirB2